MGTITGRDKEITKGRIDRIESLYVLPLLLIVMLLAIYMIAPAFYLEHVLQELKREQQVVEIITFLCGLVGSLLILSSAARLLMRSPKWLALRGPAGAAAIMGVIGLAGLFFAGEEISWGQSYFGWETPEEYLEVSIETNLHNRKDIPISVQGLGSFFLICMFMILPLVWHMERKARDRDPHSRPLLPRAWAPAIAEGPVVFTFVVAFVWKECKNIYLAVVDVGDRPDPRFYWDFLEQVNEHKEMLVAVGLLMYGLYRIRATRTTRSIETSQAQAESDD
ncbi:MAG: hypothetical protein ACR2GY_08950 [Phycisphaerales bacterium]